jgi:hypothetical protein
VCRIVGGKVTYVHRHLWPAPVLLAGRFSKKNLAAIKEVHYLTTKSGFLRRASASKGAVFDFVFYPRYLLAENWPPYMNYVRWWESLAN